MKKKCFGPPSLSLLLIILLGPVVWAGTESDCKCHDRPSLPCIRQEIRLENIEVPEVAEGAKISIYHERLDKGDSEVWVFIETKPSGACGCCAQTYVLFAPDRDIGDGIYRFFNDTDPQLTASRVVFSMLECSKASELSMRMAIVTEGDYDDTMELLAPFVKPGLKSGDGLLLDGTGDRDESDAEDHGWSARLDGAWLNSLFDRVTYDDDNVVVLPITPVSTPTMNNLTSERNVAEPNNPANDLITVKLRGNAYPIGCNLRCSEDDSPTDAEKHFKSRKLCDLASFVGTASPGFTRETAPGGNLPANAEKQETSVKKHTYTRSDGAKVELTFVTRVIYFKDGSRYLANYTLKKVTTKDGKVEEVLRDCLESAWLPGSDEARLRSLLETYKEAKVVHQYSGGTPSDPFTLPDVVDWTGGTQGVPDEIRVTVPSGTALDLTGVAAAASPLLAAKGSITIRADAILSPEGAPLETLFSPLPRLLPASDELSLLAPEVASVSPGGDTVDLVVVNRSGTRESVSISLSDTRGWVFPESFEVSLAAGQAILVSVHLSASSQESEGATSVLTASAYSERLGYARALVELRVAPSAPATGAPQGATETETGSPAGTTVTPPPGGQAPQKPGGTAQISVPQDIASCAQTLAWKGGRLGRTDPSQRWDAREDRPGEFCEPCGHTPMCAVCMEWDLQAWQQERGKTFTDLASLLTLRGYLSQVAGRPEYYAVAAIYWEAHWDGWHNRDAP